MLSKRQTTNHGREALGFVVAPLGALLTVSAFLAITGPDSNGPQTPTKVLVGLLRLSVWVLPLAYLMSAAVAVPLLSELQRRRMSSLQSYLMVGAVTGTVPFLGYLLVGMIGNASRIPSGAGEWRFAFAWMAVGAVSGLVSATLFWWIAGQNRSPFDNE